MINTRIPQLPYIPGVIDPATTHLELAYPDVSSATGYTSTRAYIDDILSLVPAVDPTLFWGTSGNNVLSGDFIGSTNAQAVVFKANNNESARIVSGGSWGWGTITPSARGTFKGQTSDDTTVGLDVRNSSNILTAAFRNDGMSYFGPVPTPSAKVHIQGVDSTSSNYSLKVDDISSRSMIHMRNDNILFVGDNSIDGYLFSRGLGGQIVLGNENAFLNFRTVSNNNKFYFTNGSAGANSYAQINTSNGNWLLGNPSTNVFTESLTNTKLWVQGVDSTSSNHAAKFDNSSATPLFHLANNGHIGQNVLTNSGIQYFLTGDSSTYGFFTNGTFSQSNYAASGGTSVSHYLSTNPNFVGIYVDSTNVGISNRIGGVFDVLGTNSAANTGLRINVANGLTNNAIDVTNGDVFFRNSILDVKGRTSDDTTYNSIFKDFGSLDIIKFRNDGYVIQRAIDGAIPNASLANSQFSFYLDESVPGSELFVTKVKLSSGVVKTVSQPLI